MDVGPVGACVRVCYATKWSNIWSSHRSSAFSGCAVKLNVLQPACALRQKQLLSAYYLTAPTNITVLSKIKHKQQQSHTIVLV